MQINSPLSLPSIPYCFSQQEPWCNLFCMQLSTSIKSVGIQFETSTLPAAAAASPPAAAPRAAPCMGSTRRDCPGERQRGRGARREGRERVEDRSREAELGGRASCPAPVCACLCLPACLSLRRAGPCRCGGSEAQLITTAAAARGETL